MVSGLCGLLAAASACDSGGEAPPAPAAGTAAPVPGAAGAGMIPAPTTAAGSSAGTAGSTGTAAVPSTPMTGTTAGTGASATAGMPSMPAPTAGTAAPAGAAGGGAEPMSPTMNPPATGTDGPDLRGMCPGLNSGYPDDRACMPAPAADQGLQIHVGPKSYTDQADVAQFVFQPGEESSECWTFHTPNDKEVYYQTFTLSGRAGTHHIINTMYSTPMTDGGFTVCADPGTGTNGNIIDNLPGASKAYMPRGIVAPENKNVGRKIPPNAASQADMHYFNFTDKPILREFWMNVYFAKKEDITQEAAQIRGMGGIGWTALPIAPGTDMVYKYECPISGNGRILSLLGHYHAHGKKFTASIRRGSGMTEKVFEMYDYQDPATFEYDSVQKNPAFSGTVAGATSGILEVKAGDVLMWDCHIINDSDTPLTYTNEVKTGEMCNLWGSSLGIDQINCVLF
jgi:hypothetical protein